MDEPTPTDEFEVVITGGTVVDGTGGPRFRADVAVVGDRIRGVGDFTGRPAARRVDARDLVVAPGFIDAHTHDDRLVLSAPEMTPKVSQGVTTVVAGNCGVSLAPLVNCDPPPPLNLLGGREWYRFSSMEDYLQAVESDPPAVNLAMLVGHSTLRAGVMTDLNRPASPSERARMGERLDESLDAGAIGMSTGLAYPPAASAPTDEIVALAQVLSRRHALYTTHMRDEGDGVVDSVREAIEIGRRAGVAVVISHHKCSGRRNWGLSRQTLALIAAARRSQTVDLDVYPYTASSSVLMGEWIEKAERVLITWSDTHPDQAGRDLIEIARDWRVSQSEAAARLQPAGAIYFQMDEDDLRRIMSFADTMIGSDGLPHDACPHPRLWGTFPRVLGHYQRELGLLTLEEAVRRMTSVPARVFGLSDRGTVRAGAIADLVIFDPRRVIDTATFSDPQRSATGIERVIVNGADVWADRKGTGSRPGRVLRRSST